MLYRMLIALFIVLLLLGACTADNDDATSAEAITVQLKWVHQAQFAGFYVAEAQGFYADENLDVNFLPGGVEVDIIASVMNGTAAFGVAGADSIIIERTNGLPVTAIATTYRVNPFVLVTFADSGITSPRDFVGRTVSVLDSYGDSTQLYAMLDRVDVDPTEVNFVPYTYDNAAFINGDIDVLNSFAAGSLLALQDEVGGRELRLIWPADYGVHFYSDTIFTTDSLIDDNPDIVLRFLRATLRGHRFAIEHPTIAVDATMPYAVVQDRAVQTNMFGASMPLVHTGEDHIGWMRESIWQDMHDSLMQHGFISTPVPIDRVLSMQFLYDIYGASS